MTANPIDLVGGLTTNGNVPKSDLTAWAKARVPQALANATEVRNTVLAGQLSILLVSNGTTYIQDTTDTTTADDGVNCIVSSDGKRFKTSFFSLPNSSVTNSKLADMADSTVKGRAAGAGTGAPQDLTVNQLRTLVAPSLQRLVMPSDFASKSLPVRYDVAPRSVNGAGVGSVVMSRTPSDIWRSIVRKDGLSNTYAYVDPVNGSDGNSGTQASPYKTLQYALATSTATNIVGIPTGPFNPPRWNGGSTVAFQKRLTFLGAAVIRQNGAGFPDASALTWTNTSGAVWQTSLSAMSGLSAPHRFLFQDDTFDFGTGLNTRLPQYANLTALQSASNANPTTVQGWAYNSSTKVIYVAFANFSVETYKSKFQIFYLDTDGDSTLSLFAGVTLFIDSPYQADFEGVSLQGYNNSSSTPSFLIEGRGLCRVFAANGNGIHTSGGFHYFSGVDVEAPQFDCFNHDPSDTGTESMVVIHHCQGNYAGDIPTFGTGVSANRNGRSLHGGTHGICCGNLFMSNWGPNIADTAIAGTTSLTWSVGEQTVQASNSQAGMAYYGIVGDATAIRKAWVDSALTYDETDALHSEDIGVTVKYTNSYFNTTPTTSASGTLATYSRNFP